MEHKKLGNFRGNISNMQLVLETDRHSGMLHEKYFFKFNGRVRILQRFRILSAFIFKNYYQCELSLE